MSRHPSPGFNRRRAHPVRCVCRCVCYARTTDGTGLCTACLAGDHVKREPSA